MAELIQRRGPWACVTFTRLVAMADQDGRFLAEPAVVNATLHPLDGRPTLEVAADLAAMAELGHLVLYAQGGQLYGYFPKWREHQPAPKADRYRPSTLPAPPDPRLPAVDIELHAHSEPSGRAAAPSVVYITPGNEKRAIKVPASISLLPLLNVLQEVHYVAENLPKTAAAPVRLVISVPSGDAGPQNGPAEPAGGDLHAHSEPSGDATLRAHSEPSGDASAADGQNQAQNDLHAHSEPSGDATLRAHSEPSGETAPPEGDVRAHSEPSGDAPARRTRRPRRGRVAPEEAPAEPPACGWCERPYGPDAAPIHRLAQGLHDAMKQHPEHGTCPVLRSQEFGILQNLLRGYRVTHEELLGVWSVTFLASTSNFFRLEKGYTVASFASSFAALLRAYREGRAHGGNAEGTRGRERTAPSPRERFGGASGRTEL